MRVFRNFSWRSLIGAVSMAAFLAGCGGGGSGSPSADDGAAPPTGSAAGVFTDAPVNGLNYAASPSGVSGVTGDNGTDGGFRYEPGDTVTFSLGGLTLGSAEGAASVSPADIASDDPVAAANLLVLLQSLDSDPAEGVIQITLPATTSLSSLDLAQNAADFSSSPAFTAAVTAAGGAVVDVEDAKAHAASQFWAQVAGIWVLRSTEGSIVVRVDDQGNYLMGETGEADDAGGPGVEAGQMTWDPTTRRVTATVSVDTNGEWGLSDPQGGAFTLRFDGTQIHIADVGAPDDSASLARGTAGTSPLHGVWAVQFEEGEEGQTPPVASFTFAFTTDNRYLMIDPIGDTPDANDPDDTVCGGPGIEGGTYSYADGMLTVQTVLLDTNGCGGLNDDTLGGTGKSQLRNIGFSADGKTMTADIYTQAGDADGSVRLVRVSP